MLSLLLANLAGPAGGGMPGPGTAGADSGVAYAAKIEPAVWQALADAPDGRADALIQMAAQADLSFAEKIDDWNARGWAVYNALRASADASQARVRATLAQQQRGGHAGAYQSFWIVNLIVVRADRAALLAAAALPEVAAVQAPPHFVQDEPDTPGDREPASAPSTVEWNISKVRADAVWSTYGVTGTGAVVADVDTGAEYTHTALINQYRGNLGGGNFDHNYNWFDAVSGSQAPRPVDDNEPFHGTHTLGTMVGWDGGANQIGVAPGAKWIATTGGGEWFDYPPTIAALQWVLAPTRLDGSAPDPSKRPDSANNSWHGTSYGSFNYDAAYAALRAAGVFIAGSAGNDGTACATNNSPNNTPAAFNVGATTSSDAIAGFSSRGPNPFRTGTSPEISAPGNNVRSSVPGNGYATYSGTSMSAPHVAGAVALLVSLEPKLRGHVSELEELLRRTADAKTSTQTCGGVPGSSVPNNTFGWGRLNVKAAADMIYHAGWLSGTVTSAGNAVPGALVTFSNSAYTYTLSTRSDADGRYRVLAGAGTWNMTAAAYGYPGASANGLVVTHNNATTHNFDLGAALALATVSGNVRDAATSAGVAAYVEIANVLEAQPAWADAAGAYAISVPPGTYTLTVSHPGYTPQSAGLVVAGNVTQDFNLAARANYTCLDSRDPGGPAYNWIEASGGVAHNMSNSSSFQVTLPGAFSYFGTNYTKVWVGSDGLIQFATVATNLPYLYLPWERLPNTDVLVLGEDYDPRSGARGIVYTKTVGSQVVFQWQDVQHYSGGNPETFQVVLDLADNSITSQFKQLSWPDFAGGGLENSTGSAGQLWNYMNSAHIADSMSVRYAPASGNDVNWGCDHALMLEHVPSSGVVALPGNDVTFRLSSMVVGPFGAPGVAVSATVPAGTQFVAASTGGTLSGNVVTWNFMGNTRPRTSANMWYTVRPADVWPSGAVIRSLATISDARGMWRQQAAYVIVQRSGLPPHSLLLPSALRNTP